MVNKKTFQLPCLYSVFAPHDEQRQGLRAGLLEMCYQQSLHQVVQIGAATWPPCVGEESGICGCTQTLVHHLLASIVRLAMQSFWWQHYGVWVSDSP